MSNNNRPIIESKQHNHHMIYAGSSRNNCVLTRINQCSDPNCGYWEIESQEQNACNMQVYRYSTDTTCYICMDCERTDIDHT